MNSMMYIVAFVFLGGVFNGQLFASGQILRTTYCYGDSSHASNLVDISCPQGEVIRMLDIVAATKASVLGCPSEDHDYTPAEQERCCMYNATDCMSSYTGNTESYYNCTAKTRCSGIPIVFQPSICNSTTHPPFTNYLILEYDCVLDGLLNGACATTQDCLVNNTICSNYICQCVAGYSEYDAMCFEDGSPKGGCLSGNTCTYDNAYCSSIDGRCKCRTGYIEDEHACIKISSTVQRPGYCIGDNSHANNLVDITCASGVIHVLDVLVGAKPSSVGCPSVDQTYTPALQEACCTFNQSTDCIASYTGTTGAYYNCNGKIHCDGIPVVQQQTDCPGTVTFPRFTNYLVLEYVCVPEGQIHGPCDEPDSCIDRNSECFDQTCQCVEGFSDLDHYCWKDGTPGVDCTLDGSCEDPSAFCSHSNNTCVCSTGYLLVDGACAEHCTSSPDCSKNLTICFEGACVCIEGYSFVSGECTEDKEVGGVCSNDGTCIDINAVCGMDNVCACKDGYSVVGDTCKLDGSIGGQCGNTINVVCKDSNARCTSADIGLCECTNGYQNVFGICKQDGCVGCVCQTDSECTESNSECGSDSKCKCSQGYDNVDENCLPDGSLNGTCLPNFTCLDPYAVCINRKCQCNDVRQYKAEAGRCVRQERYLNGICNTPTLQCLDSNAHCASQTNRCACNNGYFEVNGVCKQGDSSSVTSCAGTSPYNTLAPDCDRNSTPLKIRTYTRRKIISTGCTKYLHLYNHTYYQQCCTEGPNDCSSDDIAQGSCSAVYYSVTEYECLSDTQLIDVDADNETTGPDVGVVTDNMTDTTPISDATPTSVYNCSIQASCQTDIRVFVLLNRLQKVSGNCSTTISISGDGGTTTVDCDGPPTNHYTSIFNVTSGFIGVQVKYRGRINGGFSILFRAINRNALLTARCGIGAKVTGISTLGSCGSLIKDNKTINADDDDTTTGPECGLAYPNTSDSNTGPSNYFCSVEASCTTAINVYVLVNTIENVNGICSCNISLVGDSSSSVVTCDYPRPSFYNKVFSVSDGFVTADITYHQRIHGQFLILFRAADANATLTLACGKYAKPRRNPNTRRCGFPVTGDPSVGGPDDGPIKDITFVDGGPVIDTGRRVYTCSVQASCLTHINVYVLRNTLQEINGICSCNISIISDNLKSEVTCRGPASNAYTHIMVVSSGFARVDISTLAFIRGSFVIRFEAVNKNAKLLGYCGSRAKTVGISNLHACPAVGEVDDAIEVDSDDEVIGSETIVKTPGYPGEIVPSPGNGPSVYYCSVQASCKTNINVFVLVNTLQKNNGICTCNVTIHGDGTSTSMTCDSPMGNYFLPVHTFTDGFIRLDIHYHGNIYGRFVISFRATNEYARLTTGCGKRAKIRGKGPLEICTAFGKDDNTVEVHTNDTKNKTDVSLVNPGYTTTGTIPTAPGISRYICSVQASCFTDIDVFVLLNSLQKTNDVCSCNISMTSQVAQSDVNCEGPSQNRYTPIMVSSSGFIKVDIDYKNNIVGEFVIEFRAINRYSTLSIGCGSRAALNGVTALNVCPEPIDEITTIEVDDDGTALDKDVTITNPSSPGSASWPRGYWCSVQANCSTPIDVYVVTNAIDKVNGLCSCTIALIGSAVTENVTCDGPGSNRFVPIFTEPLGFLRVHAYHLNEHFGQYSLKFEARAEEAIVNVSCGTLAALEGWENRASCDPVEKGSTGESSGGTPLGLIIGIVVALVLLLVLFVLVCIFRQKIRSKLCPEKKKVEPVDHMPIATATVEPSPMNIKFPAKLQKKDSSFRMSDYLYKEQNLDINLNIQPPVPVLTKGREDTVGRRQFKRRLTIGEELAANAIINEEIEKEKEEKAEKKMAKKKKMRKFKNVFTAAKAFQLPQTLDTQPVGTYRPLGEAGAPQGAHSFNQSMNHGMPMDQPPLPFIQSIGGHSQTRGSYGPPSGPGLPDFTDQNVEHDHPRPSNASVRLPPLNFEPAKAWRRMGAVTGVVAHVAVKRRKTLDIADIDQPDNVEHNLLE